MLTQGSIREDVGKIVIVCGRGVGRDDRLKERRRSFVSRMDGLRR